MTDTSTKITYINAHPELYLKAAKTKVQGKTTYICPFCGNGSGKTGTGLTSKDGVHLHCFKCGFHGDMVELIAQEQGIADSRSKEALQAAFNAYHLQDGEGKTVQELNTTHAEDQSENAQEQIREYFNRVCTDTADVSYLQARGIDEQTARRLRFGYDEKEQAVVIPTAGAQGFSYTLRYTDEHAKPRYKIAKGAGAGFFNISALFSDPGEVFFITEGAIDAASVEACGARAFSINSTSNAKSLISFLTTKKTAIKDKRFVVLMDADAAGRKAAKELSEGLQELNVDFAVCDLSKYAPGVKDANEALQSNKEGLYTAIAEGIIASHGQSAEIVARHKVAALLPAFEQQIKDGANNKPIQTGFPRFDSAIGGGLLPKFYLIGAIASLGKTAFVLQIADNIAKNGGDVLLFSLEMPKEELIGRSISRQTYIYSKEQGLPRLAKTELGITCADRYSSYSADELNAIKHATGLYMRYAGQHISIYEGKHTAQEIRTEAERYIRVTGKRPVIVIDYLQIVQPAPELMRAGTKEQTDFNIDVFASMRRELKVPVIGISSFNRQSYTTVADNSSFKESGSIEYTGDCVITLELDFERHDKGAEGKTQNKNKEAIRLALAKENRDIILTFQKNRGNRLGGSLYYTYNPAYNYFEENLLKEEVAFANIT